MTIFAVMEKEQLEVIYGKGFLPMAVILTKKVEFLLKVGKNLSD